MNIFIFDENSDILTWGLCQIDLSLDPASSGQLQLNSIPGLLQTSEVDVAPWFYSPKLQSFTITVFSPAISDIHKTTNKKKILQFLEFQLITFWRKKCSSVMQHKE